MQIIKLSATHSTNLYLKDIIKTDSLEDFTIVVADEQTMGRGQMGAIWVSEPCKNLTFSVFKKLDPHQFTNPFMLNIIVSLAVYNTLNKLQIPNLSVKWPNDILSGHSKICGILIENILIGNQMNASVIGIGLNVNQTTFGNLPNVSSLKLLTDKNFDLGAILKDLQLGLKQSFFGMDEKGPHKLQREYEEVLFRKDKPSTFKDPKGEMFMGFIRGVSAQGRLVVTLEDDVRKEFDMKSIHLLY